MSHAQVSYPVRAPTTEQGWNTIREAAGIRGEAIQYHIAYMGISFRVDTAANLPMYLLPDDTSRVKLSNVDDDPCSDYINASYIPVSEHPGYGAQDEALMAVTQDIPHLLSCPTVLSRNTCKI